MPPLSPVNLGQINTAGGITATNIPGLITAALPYLMAIAGILLLGVIIFAGFQMLTGANDPKKVDSAKNMLTTSLLGFAVLFAAYWIAQILEVIFNFPILGN